MTIHGCDDNGIHYKLIGVCKSSSLGYYSTRKIYSGFSTLAFCFQSTYGIRLTKEKRMKKYAELRMFLYVKFEYLKSSGFSLIKF